MFNTVSKVKLERAVKSSYSAAEVARKIGVNYTGANMYRQFYKAINKHEIDISHFNPYKNRPNKSYNKKPIHEYLVKGDTYITSYRLKNYIIKEKLLREKCSSCNKTKWLGGKIPLQLDHIDGNYYNNELKNLRLLCPNCHALTDTYCSKSGGVGKIVPITNKSGYKREKSICIDCGVSCTKKCERCKKCNDVFKTNTCTKIEWPEDFVLLSMVQDANYSKVAKQLGVSDNAIRKRLSKRGLV